MIQFQYKGINKKSKAPVSGTLQANTRQEALKSLSSQGIQPIKLTQGAASGGLFGLFKSSKAQSDTTKFKGKNLAEDFLGKLLQLHKSGMPIGDAIKNMKERLRDPEQQLLATRLWHDLSEGQTLAASLARFPSVFDNSIIYAVEAGEASGNLAPILQNVVDSLKAQSKLKKTIYSGLAYPIFVSVVAICVVALFLFYLLPRIQGMMKSLGGEMTLSARILIGSSDALIKFGPFVLVGALIGAFLIQRWRATTKGRLETDSWLIKFFFIKNLIKEAVIARTSNLMATLIDSGVNTTESMRLTEKLIDNKILQQRFQASQKMINDGASISLAFRQNDFYPDLALDILSVGENTGNIAHSFREIYEIYTEQLTQNLKKLTTFISSAALLFAFMLVSILAMSIVTSVLQFSNSLIK